MAKMKNTHAFYSDEPLDALPDWIKEKEIDAEKDLNLDEMTEFKNKKELKEDFLSKLLHNKVSSVEEYYSLAQDRSISMAT